MGAFQRSLLLCGAIFLLAGGCLGAGPRSALVISRKKAPSGKGSLESLASDIRDDASAQSYSVIVVDGEYYQDDIAYAIRSPVTKYRLSNVVLGAALNPAGKKSNNDELDLSLVSGEPLHYNMLDEISPQRDSPKINIEVPVETAGSEALRSLGAKLSSGIEIFAQSSGISASSEEVGDALRAVSGLVSEVAFLEAIMRSRDRNLIFLEGLKKVQGAAQELARRIEAARGPGHAFAEHKEAFMKLVESALGEVVSYIRESTSMSYPIIVQHSFPPFTLYGPITCRQELLLKSRSCHGGGSPSTNKYVWYCACSIGRYGEFCEQTEYRVSALTKISFLGVAAYVLLKLLFHLQKVSAPKPVLASKKKKKE